MPSPYNKEVEALRISSQRKAKPYWIVDEKTGCWLWQFCRKPSGYGQVRWKRKPYQAHRWVYERLVGPVPRNMEVHHEVCNNRGCVNPNHMEIVTHRENLVRKFGNGEESF